MSDITFSRFFYPDTNILGYLAKDLGKWRPLQDFLRQNDLSIALSGGQASELSDAGRLHGNLNTLLTAVPTILARPLEDVLEDEVRLYPQIRQTNIVGDYLNRYFLTNRLGEFLESPELAAARAAQLRMASQMASRLADLKKNFPPREDGTYGEDQAEEFIWAYILQWLAQFPVFLSQFQKDASKLSHEPFLSVSMIGYVLFYKYCIHGKEPRTSDFGDLFHLYLIPYCELAVLERDLCNVLNHVKGNHSILKQTIVRNVEFLEDWSF